MLFERAPHPVDRPKQLAGLVEDFFATGARLARGLHHHRIKNARHARIVERFYGSHSAPVLVLFMISLVIITLLVTAERRSIPATSPTCTHRQGPVRLRGRSVGLREQDRGQLAAPLGVA